MRKTRVGMGLAASGHDGGVHKGVPGVTIKLPHAMRTSLGAEMRLDLLPWMSARLGRPAADFFSQTRL